MKKSYLTLTVILGLFLLGCEEEDGDTGPCAAYKPINYEVVVTNNDDRDQTVVMWYREIMKEDFPMECIAEAGSSFEDGGHELEVTTGGTTRKAASCAGINGRAEIRLRTQYMETGEVITDVSDGDVLYITIDNSGELSMTSSGGDYNDPGNTDDDDDPDPLVPPNIYFIDYYQAGWNIRDYCETTEGLGHRANLGVRCRNTGGPLDKENYRILVEYQFDGGGNGSYYADISFVKEDEVGFNSCYYFGSSKQISMYLTIVDIYGNEVSNRSHEIILNNPK